MPLGISATAFCRQCEYTLKQPSDLFPAHYEHASPSTLWSTAVRLSSQKQKFVLITKKGSSCEIIKNYGLIMGQYALDTIQNVQRFSNFEFAVCEVDKHLNQLLDCLRYIYETLQVLSYNEGMGCHKKCYSFSNALL